MLANHHLQQPKIEAPETKDMPETQNHYSSLNVSLNGNQQSISIGTIEPDVANDKEIVNDGTEKQPEENSEQNNLLPSITKKENTENKKNRMTTCKNWLHKYITCKNIRETLLPAIVIGISNAFLSGQEEIAVTLTVISTVDYAYQLSYQIRNEKSKKDKCGISRRCQHAISLLLAGGLLALYLVAALSKLWPPLTAQLLSGVAPIFLLTNRAIHYKMFKESDKDKIRQFVENKTEAEDIYDIARATKRENIKANYKIALYFHPEWKKNYEEYYENCDLLNKTAIEVYDARFLSYSIHKDKMNTARNPEPPSRLVVSAKNAEVNLGSRV